MAKKYVNRKAYMEFMSHYIPTVVNHTPCTFGHDEGLIYG